MASNSTSESDAGSTTSKYRLIQEIAGLAVLALALTSLLAIVSFNPADLQANGSPTNLIGPFGVKLGDGFLYLFGVGSFMFDALLWYIGFALILGRYLDWTWSEISGQLILIASTAVLAHLGFDEYVLLGHQPGGLIGEYSGELLRGFFGLVGAYIIAAHIFVASLLLATNVSLQQLFRRIISGFHQAQAWVRHKWRVYRRYRERLAEEKRKLQTANARTELPPEEAAKRDAEVTSAPVVPDNYGFEETENEVVEQKLSEKLAGWFGFGKDKGESGKQQSNSSDQDSVPDSGGGDATDRQTPEAKTSESNESSSDANTPTQAEPKQTRPDQSPKIVKSNANDRAEKLRRRANDAETVSPIQHDNSTTMELPSLEFLDYEPSESLQVDEGALHSMANQLEQTLADFKIEGEIIEICPGPVITRFEFKPAPGIKISKISNRSDDLAMALAAESIRIIAPIPGKSAVGIEVPNPDREMVYLREIIASEAFVDDEQQQLPLALGKGIEGEPIVADLTDMPHLLVAGATGSGKSVAVNSMVCSLLYRHTPSQLKLIMIDPKMLEFNVYEEIPHLLHPVVTDPDQATAVVQWAVQEMERRYRRLAELGVRNLPDYNEKVQELRDKAQRDRRQGREDSPAIRQLEFDADGEPKHDEMPYLVIVIDEFADLLMTSSKETEEALKRLAQKARAAGIHLIISTQRPSAKVIDGVIRSNFPARIGLRVSSGTNSKIILDKTGAENLLGNGDMLMKPPGAGELVRIHGAFVREQEISQITTFLREQKEPDYNEQIPDEDDEDVSPLDQEWEKDEYYDDAVRLVVESDKASISMLQRKLRVGYNRAARMVDRMEQQGIVGSSDGCNPREVLIDSVPDQLEETQAE